MSENQSLADRTNTDKQTEFKREQEADPGLQYLWQQTEQPNGRVTVINGLLYRRISPHVSTTHDYTLVIPACYEQYVIRAAHSVPSHAATASSRVRFREAQITPSPATTTAAVKTRQLRSFDENC